MKYRMVRTDGQIDAKFVIAGGIVIILRDALPQIAGRHANHGFRACIVISGTPEYVNSDQALLEFGAAVIQRFNDDIAKKARQPLAAAEHRA